MAKKRTNGEGTIRQRETGLWECTIMDGFQPNGKLKNQPNTLTRYLNAQSGPLRERYGVEYTPSRENNVKYICLEPVCDNSDTSDACGGASNTEKTALIGQSA